MVVPALTMTSVSYYPAVSFLVLFLLPIFLGITSSKASASSYDKTGFEELSPYLRIQEEPTSENSGGLSLYEDPLLGLKLRYPSDWQQDITERSVSFSKIDESQPPNIFIFTATVDTLEPKIMVLDQFVRAGVSPFREVPGFELINYDKGAMLAGLPAHKVTFVMPDQNVSFSKTISYFAMVNNTGYGVAYQVSSVEKEKLDMLLNTQLSTFERMVDSFQILS